jgi:hypothetical protein
MLKKIRERHEIIEKTPLKPMLAKEGEQAHQDRAYLLGEVEKRNQLLLEAMGLAVFGKGKSESFDRLFNDFVEKVREQCPELTKLEGKGGGMRPCPEWNSNKGICNLDSKTCMVSQYDWQNCPKGE